MAILLDSDSLVLIQGMTGAEGRKHTCRMLSTETRIVSGVDPRKVGITLTSEVEGCGPAAQHARNGDVEVPVLGTVAEGMTTTGVNTTVTFAPPAFARDAALEVIDTDIQTIVAIAEGIPVADATVFVNHALEASVRLIGPSCPGIISPGQSNVGITPMDITGPGRTGLVPESDTLVYQLMYELHDIGFTTCLGTDEDPIAGITHIDVLEASGADPGAELIVMIGEVGGDAKERATAWIVERMTKSTVGCVAGFTAPEGKTMGHTSAIVSGSSGTAAAKAEALEAVGVEVGRTPS